MSLQEQILEAGIENCLFLVPMRPVRSVFGFISYTSSDDPEIVVPARITEERYRISDDYKITLVSDYEKFGKNHYYFMDIEQLIKNGTIEFFIRGKK